MIRPYSDPDDTLMNQRLRGEAVNYELNDAYDYGGAPVPTRLDAAYEAVAEYIGTNPDESQQLIAAKCGGLLAGYDARWRDAGYVPIVVEKYYEADLMNPATNAKSRTFRLGGKVDLIAELNGRSFLFDHKTTSHDITDPNAPYWRQLAIEGQVSQYMLLLWLHGIKVDNAVWDVVKKPSISPKKLSKAERAQAASLGEYFGGKLSAASQTAMATDERETLEMYELRLAHDCTVERPEYYFQRRAVPRMESELLEYAEELWSHSQDLIETRRNGRHVRNSGACMLYGAPCRYLGVCSGHDTIDSDKWRRKTQVHTEIPIVEGDGRNILTNSRVRCWQTCRRKHQLDYELGVERIDEEEREALFFGSCIHAGLNAWWSHNMEPERNAAESAAAT